jgi:hypothetical protein
LRLVTRIIRFVDPGYVVSVIRWLLLLDRSLTADELMARLDEIGFKPPSRFLISATRGRNAQASRSGGHVARSRTEGSSFYSEAAQREEGPRQQASPSQVRVDVTGVCSLYEEVPLLE